MLLWLAADVVFGPMPKERLMRRFTATEAGPFSRLTGIMVSPDCGTVSKLPKPVWTTLPAIDDAVAKEGRSLKKLSPVRSLLVVMLNGLPDWAIRNGLKLMPHGPV